MQMKCAERRRQPKFKNVQYITAAGTMKNPAININGALEFRQRDVFLSPIYVRGRAVMFGESAS